MITACFNGALSNMACVWHMVLFLSTSAAGAACSREGCAPVDWVWPGIFRKSTAGEGWRRGSFPNSFSALFLCSFFRRKLVLRLPPRGAQKGWSRVHDAPLLLGIPQALGAAQRKVRVLHGRAPASTLPAMPCCLIQAGSFWLSEIHSPDRYTP